MRDRERVKFVRAAEALRDQLITDDRKPAGYPFDETDLLR